MDMCHSDKAATAQVKSINDSAEINKIKKCHSGDVDRQTSVWEPGSSRSHRTMQRKQNATVMVTLHAHVNSMDKLTHSRNNVAQHG